MKKALVVDDTKNIRTMLTTCLELKGYSVNTASNGTDALELIKKEAYDMAFIDIKMPEISGTEVLRRIRAMGLNFPVVIMTAFATVKNAVECTNLGAVAYLQKPFSQDKVNDVLSKLEDLSMPEESIDIQLKQAKRLLEMHSYDEAYSCLKRLLSQDPSLGEVYYLIGLIHDKNGKKNTADKFYGTSELFGYNIR